MDKRKEQILKAIIKEYILEAEPVSSKTIMNRYGLNVSSATIRNEMAALEELGYIQQPHISSGRVPAPSGYRYYVDNLMEEEELLEEINLIDQLTSNISNINNYLKEVALMLAGASNYTVIVTEEKRGEETIHHLKLVGLLEDKALLVLVLSSNKVKDYVIPYLEKLSEEELISLSEILNQHLKDKEIKYLTLDLKNKIKGIFPNSPLLLEEIFNLIEKSLEEENNVEVIVEGVKNIFKLPEFNEVKKIAKFMETIENQEIITGLLRDAIGSEGNKIGVKIGEELGLEDLKDFTLIATNCSFCEGLNGKIGIIGPTRMFYEKNISLLEALLKKEDEND
ncbi:MAG: heat-inducible transcriptional repressor HrcA [Fusobacteria bacterium]|nr:heat-inducible transcriptional repressor HrcA [Fusobacteriota bacterium]